MAARWLFGVGVLSALGAGPAPEATKPDLAAYEAVKATVGRDADAQVKLALWCEAHGLSAERVKHLALAVLTDPKNVAARGLLGMVEYGSRWQRPEAVSEKVRSDEALTAKLAEYNGRRNRAPQTQKAQWGLALWCEANGLKAEATAHFVEVTRINPRRPHNNPGIIGLVHPDISVDHREAAWKRLGCVKVGHRWVTPEQIAAEESEAEAQEKADRHWKPLLARYQARLRDKDPAKRDQAESQLANVYDPRAVPSVWAVFGTGDEASQETAVGMLGRIDAGGASRALAALAVYGKSVEVRRAATETLKNRDPRDFVGLLIGMLRDPLRYEVKPVNGPDSPGVLFVEGERYNVRMTYGPNRAQIDQLNRNPLPPRIFDSSVPFDPYGAQTYLTAMAPSATSVSVGGKAVVAPDLTVLAARRDIQIAQQVAQRQAALAVSQQQLNDDVYAVESYNAGTREFDDRVLPVLFAVTGRTENRSSVDWKSWWTDQQGYVYERPTADKPTIDRFVTNPALPVVSTHHSCFGAGTLVHTLEGPRPIETLRVGDQVLSQNTTTGRLSFVPVLRPVHNQPAATFKLALGDETVVATGIHRFWKAGHGWAMVRDLKPGDVLRTVGGTARVGTIETSAVQPVFNLEVGANQTFFVGGPGALVHDNSLVTPVALPFDAEPTLASLAPGVR